MSAAWPSSKGLSVFNALKLGGPMTPRQIADYLREHWDPKLSDDYVIDGLGFIAEKSWIVQDEEGRLSRKTPHLNAFRTDDESDLVLRAGHK